MRFTNGSQSISQCDEVSRAELRILQSKLLKPQMDHLQQKDAEVFHLTLFFQTERLIKEKARCQGRQERLSVKHECMHI